MTAMDFDLVTKRFGATTALADLSLTVRAGSVHALLGENGAGKSTVVKLLSGLIQPDAGTISVHEERVRLPSPRDAHRLGIQTAFQEMFLVGDLTVIQNMLLPYEPVTPVGWLRERHAERLVMEFFDRFDLHGVDPDAEVRTLDLPTRQKIVIAKAVSRGPRILLLDEPTSALSGPNVDWLDGIIDQLRSAGTTIVFVTHRMREVRRFCDSLSVLRNGQHVGTYGINEISDDEVIRLMIGRSLGTTYPVKEAYAGPRSDLPVLAARGLAVEDRLEEVSFELGKGEVLGIAGLEGMGQRDLFLALFGMSRLRCGTVEIDGAPAMMASPVDAIRAGISLVPEDHKSEGLAISLTGRENISLPSLARYAHLGWVDRTAEEAAVERVLARVNVHPRATYTPVFAFSGGNQQKMVIAKWLMAETRVLLMFDPTRGVDVGTKHEIYLLIREFARAGGSILFYSTEIPEVVNLCDRVLVLYRGRFVKELRGVAITEDKIMRAALEGETSEERPLGAAVASP